MMFTEPMGIVEFNWSSCAEKDLHSRRITCKPENSRDIKDLVFHCRIGTKGRDPKYDLCFWKMNINGHWQWLPLLPRPGDAHPRSLLNEWAIKWTLKVYYLGSFVINNAVPTKIKWATLWTFPKITEKSKSRCLQAWLNLACQWVLGVCPFPPLRAASLVMWRLHWSLASSHPPAKKSSQRKEGSE